MIELMALLCWLVPVGAGIIWLWIHRPPLGTGREGLVSEVGETRTDLSPAGMVFIHGETWNAMTNAPLAKGALVRVVSVDGLKLWVEPYQQDQLEKGKQR